MLIRCAAAFACFLPGLGAQVLPGEEGGQRVQAPRGAGDITDAAQTLRGLSLEQKAGQLFMAWILSREEGQAAERQKMEALVREGLLGGIVISLGGMREARRLVARMQAAAPLPLLIASDFENGLHKRLHDAPQLGNAMLLGASGSPYLARRVGQAIGVGAEILGVHICFAPVLDVNINPQNPIINVRSFGEDPGLVSRLGVAMVQGIQERVIATAKHFPGHGDVAADSHMVLTRVPGDRARLDAVELRPFREAIAAGLGAVMTAHLEVPALDPTKNRPATVSRAIMHDLLRKELGFSGILVTDAMRMGGVAKVMDVDEACVQALAAGADILLMPNDVRAARDAVVTAVRAGRVPQERLDDAVLRLLQAKQRLVRRDLAADAAIGLPPSTWAAQRALGREVAARGLTLVQDRLGLVEAMRRQRGRRPGTVLLNVADAAGDNGRELAGSLPGIEELRLHPRMEKAAVRRVLAAAAAAEHLIVAMHIRVRAHKGSVGLPASLAGVKQLLRSHPRAIALAFGNPYLLTDFPGVSSYLAAFEQGGVAEGAVAAALRGETPITGRMPVSIPGVHGLGAGISLFEQGGSVEPARQDVDPALKRRLTRYLQAQVDAGAFPGAVAMVSRRGRVLAQVAVGRQRYEVKAPRIQLDTPFDLASLTKVCATLPALARLLAAGKIQLDDKLQNYVPAFRGGRKDQVTLRHLMTHSSGLPPFIRFFQDKEGKAQILAAAAAADLQFAPGSRTRYSDLGLMLLMAVVEKASGQDFDAFLQAEVYGPLGLQARFVKRGDKLESAAPTEEDPWRGRLVQGEVHDENAYAMGGVSGHAGLFARAADVLALGNLFLGGGGEILPAGLCRQLVQRANLVPRSSRALLFDTFRKGRSGGSKLSARAFGHTGFTGTSIWCDPATDLCLVLLTNRVHPTRQNRKISAARRGFCDLVVDCLRDR